MAVSTVSTSVAAEVVYPVLVNGYLCYSAAEVTAAKRGQSPDALKPGATSKDDDQQAAAAAKAQAEAKAQTEAKALSEAQARIAQYSLADLQDLRDRDEQSRRGGLLDIYA